MQHKYDNIHLALHSGIFFGVKYASFSWCIAATAEAPAIYKTETPGDAWWNNKYPNV